MRTFTDKGAAAVQAGSADYPQDPATDAVDAIANILHWATTQDPETLAADIVDMALTHYQAEDASS